MHEKSSQCHCIHSLFFLACLLFYLSGVARRTILGFDGPFGWVPNNTRFDNQYYEELVGEGDSLVAQIEGAPQWRQVLVENNETDLLDRWQWVGFPQGRQVIMLNRYVLLYDNHDMCDVTQTSEQK